jgi:hypothetical protein
MVSVGDDGARMLIAGWGELGRSDDLERVGGLGSDTTVFCLRGEVAGVVAGGRVKFDELAAPAVGDLPGFLAGTGGVCGAGMASSRPCSI